MADSLTVPGLTTPRRLHIVGAAGAGMSALARVLVAMGHRVSGSDLKGGEELARLADLGIDVWTGSRPEALADVEVVVASSAVPDKDPELRAAGASGVPVWRRPQLLAALSAMIPTVGASGTAGKTTSTALLVTALRAVGIDASFVVGGELFDLRTNGHLGQEDLLILEADEAFGTFEHLRLVGLTVTNIEAEHLDHFGTVANLEDSFVRVVEGVAGPVVIGADDPGARRVAMRTGRPTVGTDPEADFRMVEVGEGPESIRFRLLGPGYDQVVEVGRPGLHVARNAAGALALLFLLGYDPGPAAAGLAEFRGVRRRYELRGSVAGVTLIDDYAHHPSKVKATLETAARGGWQRIWAVFQPHLYSRTRLLHKEFGSALATADHVVVTDVYGAREEPQPGVTGELVAEAVRRAGGAVDYVAHRSDLAEFLADRVRTGDLVLTMGAGDITLVPTELAALLARRNGP